jgi:hypothetical protein
MNDSPLVVLVNLQDKSVVVLLGFFDLEQLESLQDEGNEEDWSNNGDHEEDIGEEQSNLPYRGRVILVLDLHHREEGEVEVDQHEEPQIGIELELTQSGTDEAAESREGVKL